MIPATNLVTTSGVQYDRFLPDGGKDKLGTALQGRLNILEDAVMQSYNPQFLGTTDIFSQEEISLLDSLNAKVPLSLFLGNDSYVKKYGIDFIHTSAMIEGNTYDRNDTLTLLEYGRTAGGKKYTDAKMILNMRAAFDLLLSKDLDVSKSSLLDMHYVLSDEMVADNERAVPRNESVAIAGCDYIPLATRERLDSELTYMMGKYKSIEGVYDRALYLHCNLAYLQYFKDCNKRTARMMLNLSLKNDGKMLYIPSPESVPGYVRGTVSYYETGSYELFKEHFVNEYKRTVESIHAIESARTQEQDIDQTPR
ncbi:Fic family protein [Syntrophotalea acetylenica]|uniref:Fic family protein n=1 Tax=Syntrophotalea acetylenica TaxID=29542 RepID=UPI002A35E939|nr:Fic family protein [Syntrophotalea acetylenica]MDY0263453.1 Fic family protein [Syntrophotalea acetylenica]